jgi:PAS domain S-box-containing protein
LLGVERMMKRLLALCGRDPRQDIVPFSRLDENRAVAYMSRKLIPVNDGIFELSAGRLSRKASRGIERLLGIQDMWVMGFNCQGNLFGGIALFFKTPGALRNRHLIETLVNQASLMIQHLTAEKEMRESESRFRQIAKTLETGLWILDEQSRTTFVNRAAASALGYRTCEMTGRPLSDFMFKNDLAGQKRLARKGLNGKSARLKVRFRSKNGKMTNLTVTARPVKSDRGHSGGESHILLDLRPLA